MSARNTKKIAATVLALGAATGAIVFGSFAAWTATTNNANNAVTTGSIAFTNSKPAASAFTVSNVKPSSSYAVADTVTITNEATGNDLSSSVLNVTHVTGGDAGLKSEMDLRITYKIGAGAAVPVYDGKWGAAAAGIAIPAAWPKGQARDFTFEYRLPSTTTNATQGKTAAVDLEWVGSL